MWLIILGILILLIASFWHSYSAIGTLASPAIAPMIFYSPRFFHRILVLGWLILFVIGIVMLFIANWIVAIVAIPVYWLLLPPLVTPFVRKWMLPPWDRLPDEVKDIIIREGYNKNNYLKGDWWKRNQ